MNSEVENHINNKEDQQPNVLVKEVYRDGHNPDRTKTDADSDPNLDASGHLATHSKGKIGSQSGPDDTEVPFDSKNVSMNVNQSPKSDLLDVESGTKAP